MIHTASAIPKISEDERGWGGAINPPAGGAEWRATGTLTTATTATVTYCAESKNDHFANRDETEAGLIKAPALP